MDVVDFRRRGADDRSDACVFLLLLHFSTGFPCILCTFFPLINVLLSADTLIHPETTNVRLCPRGRFKRDGE